VNPVKSRSVYRYFEPADTFVQILVVDPGSLDLEVKPGLNRAAYRRLVVQGCMPAFKLELPARLDELLPDDPLLAEDLLYQLCIEVNPSLDIHTVRIASEPRRESAHAPRAAEVLREVRDPEEFLLRLRERARALQRRLERRIIGQDEAVGAVVRAVEKAAAGLGSEGRPLSAFLLLGRTGTGKTELAKTLAAELFGSADKKGLVRIDCAEYALAHEYSKLIGAPPGYVGHEDGGQLTELVAKNPECVVLFDEIEKAHPRMHNLLLSILEDGVLTDSKGRRVSFENTLVILTSNAGAPEMTQARKQVGFGRSQQLGKAHLRELAIDAVERQFSPEFIGRLDETIVFNELDLKAAQQIAQRQLTELATRARKRGTKVAFTPAVAKWVASKGFSADYGARELRRVIQREVETPLSRRMMQGSEACAGLLRVRIEADALAIEREG
jgi:ATP-dependent Clp protease ATP-binding subunit ClpC